MVMAILTTENLLLTVWPTSHTNMTNYHIGPPWNSLRHLGTCYNNKNTSNQIIQAETTFL